MVSENDLKYDRLLTPVQAKKYRVMIVDDEQDITQPYSRRGLKITNSL
jgi:hypothetical protein